MPSYINASTTGSGGLIAFGDNSGILDLQTGGTLRVRIANNEISVSGTGRFTTPVNGTTGAVVLRSDVTNTATTHLQWTNNASTVQYGTIGVTPSNTMTFITSSIGAEAMRITSGGTLCVGTTVDGAAGEIRATGNITAYYSSDIRLKKNVKIINDPITLIDQIRGVYFDWTDDYIAQHGGEDGYFVRKHDIGVIAQEVEKILPDIVATRADGYKAVNYEKIVPLLIEAIKEQQKQIEQIQAALQLK